MCICICVQEITKYVIDTQVYEWTGHRYFFCDPEIFLSDFIAIIIVSVISFLLLACTSFVDSVKIVIYSQQGWDSWDETELCGRASIQSQGYL